MLAKSSRLQILDIDDKLDRDVKHDVQTCSTMVGIRQFDDNKVIEKALDLFWRQGLAATSMADLANATGVQRGSLYNAYGGKQELFLRAFDIYAARFLNAAHEAIDKPNARTALQAFFKVAIANMTNGSPSRGCLSTKTAAQGSSNDPSVQRRIARLLEELEGIVRTALSTAQVANGLRLPPEETALVVVTFTRGLAVMERVHRDPARLKRSAAALVKALTIDNKRGCRSG